ncbi:MAG TPA: Rv3235 family protein [Pilimelia sp.]|nr:Rv3235 family protein [Pilimelia sp.]
MAGASPDSRAAARRFTAMCLEILNGYRPTGHVRPFVTPAEAPLVIEQLTLARARVAEVQRTGGHGWDRATRLRRHASPDGGRTTPETRVVLHPVSRFDGSRRLVGLGQLRVCEPRGGAAEVAAVLRTTGRAWALAFRLERRQGAWLCTTARLL